MSEAGGGLRQKILQTVRLRPKNDNRDLSGSQILLVFDALVHGEENIAAGCFRGCKKLAILKPGQSSVTGRLAIVTG